MCHICFINISARVIRIIDIYHHVIHTCDPLHRMRRKTSHLVLIFLYFCSYTCMCARVDVYTCGGQRLRLGSSSIALHLFVKTEALTEPELNNVARSSVSTSAAMPSFLIWMPGTQAQVLCLEDKHFTERDISFTPLLRT